MTIADETPQREDRGENIAQAFGEYMSFDEGLKRTEDMEISVKVHHPFDSESPTRYPQYRKEAIKMFDTLSQSKRVDTEVTLDYQMDIHDRTDKLENRVSSLESKLLPIQDKSGEYHANSSFRNAVRDSLTEGDILEKLELQPKTRDENIEWSEFDPQTKEKIKASTIEPLHDIVVLLGLTISVLFAISSVIIGFHFLATISTIIGSFLFYSYYSGLGE